MLAGMNGYMFRSKLGALIFMGFILFAVFRVIGTEENGGQLATAADEITAQQQAMRNQPAGDAAWDAETLRNDGWGDEVAPPEG